MIGFKVMPLVNTVIAGDFNTCYIESDHASGKVDKSGGTLKEVIGKK